MDFLKRYGSRIPADTLITDTTGTKSSITMLFSPFRNFVGSHPMAGSEKTGYGHSRPGLLAGRSCIVTGTQPGPLQRIKRFWQTLDMNVRTLSPKDHDLMIGLTSHFIHWLSFSYAYYLKKNHIDVKGFFGPSFQEFTRLARSSPLIWADIFIDNKKTINIIMNNFIKALGTLRSRSRQKKKLLEVLKSSQAYIKKQNHG
jgi:prephenate dehydrogenase